MVSTRPAPGNDIREERTDYSIIEVESSVDESTNRSVILKNGGDETTGNKPSQPDFAVEFPEMEAQVTPPKLISRPGSRALLRHHAILAGCILASSLILGLSCINLNELIERPARLNEKMQLSANTDNVPLSPNLSFLRPSDNVGIKFQEGLRPVYEASWDADKIGFVDQSGRLAIKPQFSKVGDFHDGLAPAVPWQKRDPSAPKELEPWGVIDTTGKFVIQPQFRNAPFFSHGIATVQLMGDGSGESPGGLIDRSGRFLLRTPAAEAPPQRFGDLIRMKTEKSDLGLMDKNGNWVLAPIYYEIRKPELGDDRDYYRLFPYEQEQNSDDHQYVIASSGATSVIDYQGRPLMMPFTRKIGRNYVEIQSFHNNHAKVKVNDKLGIIDKTGQFVIPPEYDRLTPFGELIAGQKDKRWFVMNDKGKTIAAPINQPIFQRDLGWFEDGLAPVFYNQKCGYLNRNGQFAIEPRYVLGTVFHNGIARVWDGNLWHYINTKGEFISPGVSASAPMQNGEAEVNVPGPLYFVNAGRRVAGVRLRIGGYLHRLERLPSQISYWD